ncbi:superoxide dismutase family protein [Aquicoccus sp. SCR17]|nr:superoxide dismutase family protein [Carideicomes alvinocaridis]
MTGLIKTTATGLAALLLGAGIANAQAGASALAELQNKDGEPVGSVEVIPGPHGVVLKALLDSLPPGDHGFHLHQTGDCGDGFEAAGGHISTGDQAHGFLNGKGPHAGDLPNVIIGENGTATAQFYTDRVMLEGEDSDVPLLMDEDGTAVIVHENADTYGAEPGAGGRIACGVIEPRG